MHRRKRAFKNLESGRILRIASIVYLSLSPILLSFTTIAYLNTERVAPEVSNSIFAFAISHMPLIIGVAYLAGLGLVVTLNWKCQRCRLGPGLRITTALKKMSRGDLGWRITLRRGDELADVAASVSRASESLADRIGKLQIQARQLTEVENYLIDSMGADRISNPYTIKALRKLKICTSRLNSSIEDFQISAIPADNTGSRLKPFQTARQMEKV
jgi:methyl-accepting chemotaxis protein